MKYLLVTGGAGFIGSNYISYMLEQEPEVFIVNLDSLTYAGSLDNIKDIGNHNRHHFIKGDICDKSTLNEIFKDYNIEGVVHFAAESHVDNSIANPDAFIKTNVFGTFNLLSAAKLHWMSAPFVFKKNFENSRFHHISTDEVYGSLGKEGFFVETTPYAPNSPYSASKASSDLIARSFFHTYGMDVITTNCSNNYGPKQHDEKLIPTIIRKAISGEPIPIYGTGKNIRDWLHVLDHCSGIHLAYKKGKPGETYNIGGRNERNNVQVALTICKILDRLMPKASGNSYETQIKFVADRPGHDLRYAIDASKIEQNLGWGAKKTFETGIEETVRWYIDKYMRS